MIQLIFSMILLAAFSLTSVDGSASSGQDTKVVKRLDDGQPLVD